MEEAGIRNVGLGRMNLPEQLGEGECVSIRAVGGRSQRELEEGGRIAGRCGCGENVGAANAGRCWWQKEWSTDLDAGRMDAAPMEDGGRRREWRMELEAAARMEGGRKSLQRQRGRRKERWSAAQVMLGMCLKMRHNFA
jgi:hypothetical protein